MRITRRAAVATLSGSFAAALAQTKKAPRNLPQSGEFVRILDPATETLLLRLTSLTSSNRLPAPANRFISAKERFLVFSSDRDGHFAPHFMDLRNGVIHQITEATDLDPTSLCLDDAERSLFFIDNGVLKEVQLNSKKEQTLAEGVTAFALGATPADTLVVRDRKLQRLEGGTIAEDVDAESMMRPHRSGCFFTRAGSDGMEFCYTDFAAAGAPKISVLAKGKISFPFWSPDGQSLIFLRKVARGEATVPEIRSVSITPCSEETIEPTSQFTSFSPNRDQTVFVGASGSKAQPNVTLLLRSPQREMTLCEHHAKDAASVCPVFAPDSRRVYFQSDREGRPAIYSVNVELLVEPTVG